MSVVFLQQIKDSLSLSMSRKPPTESLARKRFPFLELAARERRYGRQQIYFLTSTSGSTTLINRFTEASFFSKRERCRAERPSSPWEDSVMVCFGGTIMCQAAAHTQCDVSRVLHRSEPVCASGMKT